jgi:hypothetical protein
MRRSNRAPRRVWILYVGDFDPSGLAIEDWAQRGNDGEGNRRTEGLFELLANKFGWSESEYSGRVRWVRVAVTLDDFEDPRLAAYKISIKDAGRDEDTGQCRKGNDPRAEEYKSRYGSKCLEAEALEVLQDGEISDRLDAHIRGAIDVGAWDASERKQKREIRDWLRTHPE